MGSTNGELKRKRAEFFSRMQETYKISNEEIARILMRSGYDGFKLSEIGQYEFTLKTHFDILEDKKGKEDKKEVHNPLGLTKTYYPCPIINCTGVKVEYRIQGVIRWECSVGGHRHYRAWLAAKARMSREPYEESIEEMATHFASIVEDNIEEEGQV